MSLKNQKCLQKYCHFSNEVKKSNVNNNSKGIENMRAMNFNVCNLEFVLLHPFAILRSNVRFVHSGRLPTPDHQKRSKYTRTPS